LIAILSTIALLAGCAGIGEPLEPTSETSSPVSLDTPPFPVPGVNPVIIPCVFRPAAVTYQHDATGITVDNGKYRAHLSTWTGALDRVELKSGTTSTVLVDDERFRIETPAGLFTESNLGGTRFVVPEATTSTGTKLYPGPHYLKVITESPVNGTNLFVRRVYEFTQGEHIYVQFEIHAAQPQTVRSWRWWFHNVAQGSAMFSSLGPTISFSYPSFDVADRTDPAHPVNSMKTNYRGYEVAVADVPAFGNWIRQSSQVVTMQTDQRILGGIALSVVPANPAHPPDFDAYPQHDYPIYAEYGLIPIGAATQSVTDSTCRFSFDLAAGRPTGVPERFFNFVDFNVYQILDYYAPVHQFAGAQGALAGRSRGALDHLLRGNMHLLERMANDGGYPQFGGWSRYACGTHYSTHARGFSSAAYLWAYLTLGWDGQRWVSCTSSADPIYAQLQYTDRFFDPGSTWTFSDELQLLGGHDYIAYATRYRENDPTVPEADKIRAAIASHTQGLHFVAMMRDAARLKGDTAASDAWRDRLVRFHAGSKAMFDRLHPGTDATNATIRYPGLMNYSLGQEYIHNTGAYSQITYRGIIPGYLEAGEYELELIEAIERMRHDWEATDAGTQGYPEHNIMWPLVRSNPLGLSFVYEPSAAPPDLAIFTGRAHGLRASYLESTVRLDDVLASGTGAFGGMHDPSRYIRDGLGRYVLSNARVLTDWVAGAWEEVASTAVPGDRRFTVTVPQIAADGSAGYWTAVQDGQRIELMSSAATAIRPEIAVDAVYGSARVQVRRHQPLSSTYPQHGTWGSAQTVASALLCVRSGDRCTFRLPSTFQLQRKDLLSLELARAPTAPTALWTGPATGSPDYALSWTGATGYITYYELQEARNASFTNPRTILVLGFFTSRLMLSQAPGSYYYRIRATNDHGLASGYTTLVDASGAPAPIVVQ
jgi:hypothetical protein